MSDTIIVAIISGVITLLGVVIANETTQAVIKTRLDNLTEEVKKHNNFAQRIPVLEEQMKVVNHRISDLERK